MGGSLCGRRVLVDPPLHLYNEAAMRAPIVFPVRIAAGSHAVQTTTREVSAEGVFVCSLRPPKPGTRISVKLYLPGASPAEEAVAVVREWRAAPDGGYWAEFIDLPQTTRERITALLERRERAAASGPPAPIGAMLLKQKPFDDPRRAFPRVEARFRVRFGTVQDFVLEYAANISAGGVFVQSEHPPQLHTVVTVAMELPDGGNPVEAKGIIVHRVTPEEAKARKSMAGMGVQFVDADDEFRERIDRAIEYILKGTG
jgi:type IV pilus assembly protein PilZ